MKIPSFKKRISKFSLLENIHFRKMFLVLVMILLSTFSNPNIAIAEILVTESNTAINRYQTINGSYVQYNEQGQVRGVVMHNGNGRRYTDWVTANDSSSYRVGYTKGSGEDTFVDFRVSLYETKLLGTDKQGYWVDLYKVSGSNTPGHEAYYPPFALSFLSDGRFGFSANAHGSNDSDKYLFNETILITPIPEEGTLIRGVFSGTEYARTNPIKYELGTSKRASTILRYTGNRDIKSGTGTIQKFIANTDPNLTITTLGGNSYFSKVNHV